MNNVNRGSQDSIPTELYRINTGRTSPKREPQTELDALAEAILVTETQSTKQTDPYQRCLSLILQIDFKNAKLGNFFDGFFEINTSSKKDLEVLFNVDEIKKVSHLLLWFHLLTRGHLPENSGYDQGLAGTKKILGIDSLVEILNPDKNETIHTDQEQLSFTDFALGMIKAYQIQDLPETPYQLFIDCLAKDVVERASTDTMLSNLKSLFNMNLDEIFKDFGHSFSNLNGILKLRWAFFFSIASYHKNDENEKGLKEPQGNWFENYYKPFSSMFTIINIRLMTMLDTTFFKDSNSCKRSTKAVESKKQCQQRIEHIKFAKTYPWQPNWMPNGLNTCYLSSTIWPMFLLLDDKIRSKLEGISNENNLKDTFVPLYKKVASLEITDITKADINNFRKAMQLTFPHRFGQHESMQEDAYEFLVCMLTELLKLNTQQFHVLHTFARVDDKPLIEAEVFNYEEALAPSCRAEPSQVLDIRLDEAKKHNCYLNDLVTKVRQTENQERNAYAKDNKTKNYRSVEVAHKEHILVKSIEEAPEFFIGRLTRFSYNMKTGARDKRFDQVCPDATLEFDIENQEQRGLKVLYDLEAITVHSGLTIDGGHYYTYFRKQVNDKWKFFKWDDINGPEICQNEQIVLRDVSKNGYIFYYKKRIKDETAPDILRLEEEIKSLNPFGYGYTQFNDFNFGFGNNPLIFSDLDKEPTSEVLSFDDWPLNDSLVGSANIPMVSPKSIEEAKIWMNARLCLSYYIDENRCYGNLSDLVKNLVPRFQGLHTEERVFNALAAEYKRSVYLIDPENDRDLDVLDQTFPIPGDRFRFGEAYSNEMSIFYLYKQRDGSYVVLCQLNE